MMKTRILVADNESLTRKSLQELLREEGYEVSTAESGLQALEILKQYPVEIILADMKMQNFGGIELLKTVRENYPETYVVLMSAYGSIENAVDAMRQGAFDYMTKPIDDDQLIALLEKITGQANAGKVSNKSVRCQFHNIIGKDQKMQEIYEMIETIADSPATILITGESGTGKRMVAQAIHQADNNRNDMPFIEVSCGALPETLLESELFGHVKGSFTGAICDRAGRFELANGGTFLLDEIDTCSANLQVKLLRILEEGNYERVGDIKTLNTDTRIIAATNQCLEEQIKRKKFREDLYWRLNVIKIEIPPLRERIVDIPLLVKHFLTKYNCVRRQMKHGICIERVSDEAMKAMMRYSWPGNIRELENTIERACILVKGSIMQIKDLPEHIRKQDVQSNGARGRVVGGSLKRALKTPEREIILESLNSTDWNCTKASASLGINRTTLYNKMKRYGIKRNKGRVSGVTAVPVHITY